MFDLLAKIALGAITGVGYSAFGYIKNRIKHGEKEFDPKALAQTVIVGACVGGVAGELGISYESAWDYPGTAGLVTFVEWAKGAIWSYIHE